MTIYKEKQRLESDPDFLAGYMKATFVGDIFQAMEEEGISKSQLAERLGKSRQYVGRVLNETANFTIDSISKIAAALERDIVLRLKAYTEVVEIKEFVHPFELWTLYRLNSKGQLKELSEKEYSEDTGVREIKVKVDEPA